MGSPSVYFVFSVPQDGIAAPADFNATVNGYLRSLWNGTSSGAGKGTLTGPDADGYYTATLTGVTIPASAKMLTGGLGYSYSVINTLPLTQTNLANYPVADATATSGLTAGMPNKTGGLIVIAPNAQKVATGFTGRRAIVEDARCNKCHQELGTFTEDAFHAGQRNDGTTCAWCHRPNQTSSGWSADSTSFIHAIHAGSKRDGDVHLARIEHERIVRRRQVSRRAEELRGLPHPRHLRLQRQRVGERVAEPPVPHRRPPASSTAPRARRSRRTPTTRVPRRAMPGPRRRRPTSACISLSPYITAGTNYGIGYSFNAGLTTSNSCKPDGTVVSNPAGGTVEADATAW